MSKTSKKIIAIAIGILLFSAIAFYLYYSTHFTAVPEGVVGATAGNLNNKGLFCESDGKVYFSNSFDEGCLYSMNPDQSDIQKVYNLKASFINAGGDYLFFHGDSISESKGLGSVVASSGLFMLKKNGNKFKALTNETSGAMLLLGNSIFYEHYNKTAGTTLYKYDLKEKTNEEILPYMVDPVSYFDGKLYYNGMYENHNLFSYSINTGEESLIWPGECWNPICEGNYVYYMDILHNYRLCRYSISDNTIEVLTEDRLDFFNVYNGVIFYAKSSKDSPALKRINIDGTGETVIANGVFNSINCTSTYTYFKEFGDEYTTYYTSTYGLSGAQVFEGARDAIRLKK